MDKKRNPDHKVQLAMNFESETWLTMKLKQNKIKMAVKYDLAVCSSRKKCKYIVFLQVRFLTAML